MKVFLSTLLILLFSATLTSCPDDYDPKDESDDRDRDERQAAYDAGYTDEQIDEYLSGLE